LYLDCPQKMFLFGWDGGPSMAEGVRGAQGFSLTFSAGTVDRPWPSEPGEFEDSPWPFSAGTVDRPWPSEPGELGDSPWLFRLGRWTVRGRASQGSLGILPDFFGWDGGPSVAEHAREGPSLILRVLSLLSEHLLSG
jgi:hypothetical protein